MGRWGGRHENVTPLFQKLFHVPVDTYATDFTACGHFSGCVTCLSGPWPAALSFSAAWQARLVGMDSRRFGKSGGELSFSATRGGGAASSGARRIRDPRFVFDAKELAEYDLPRLSESKPSGFLRQKSAGVTQSVPAAAAGGEGSAASPSDASGALPPIFPPDAAKRGAARFTSGTLSVVRDAYGIDDSKRQEVEDVASSILAKTYGQQQRGSGGGAPKPPSPRRTSVADERSAKAQSDEAAAHLAMMEVEELRTGGAPG